MLNDFNQPIPLNNILPLENSFSMKNDSPAQAEVVGL